MIKEWKRVLWLKEDKKYQNIQKTIEKILIDQAIDQATLKNRNEHIEIITNDQGFYFDDRYEEQRGTSDELPWSLAIENDQYGWKLIADIAVFENLDQHNKLLNKLNFLNQSGLNHFSYDIKLNRLGISSNLEDSLYDDEFDIIVNLDDPLSKISNQKLTNLVQYLKLIQNNEINLNYGLPEFDAENPHYSGNYQIVLNNNGLDQVVIEMLDKNDQIDEVFSANLLDCLESQWDQYCKWDWNDLEFKDLSFSSFEKLPFKVGNGMFARQLLENNWTKDLEVFARHYDVKLNYYCHLNKYGEQIKYHILDENEYKSFNTYNENQIIKPNQTFSNWLKLSANLRQSYFDNENNTLTIFKEDPYNGIKILYQFENDELEKLNESELKNLNHYLISLKNALVHDYEFNYQYFNDESNSNFQNSWELFFNNKNLVDLKDFEQVKIIVKSHSTEMQLKGAKYLQKDKKVVVDLIDVIHPNDLELKALIENYHKGRNVKKPVFKIV